MKNQWQQIKVLILCPDNIKAWGRGPPTDESLMPGDPCRKTQIDIWRYLKVTKEVIFFFYKHFSWLLSFYLIKKQPLKSLNKTSYNDGVKATPKWFIELGLTGLKPFMLQLFLIFSAGNNCFPVVLMALNIYLSPALIGFLCLLLSFPMGMKVDVKFSAEGELPYISTCCVTIQGIGGVYYDHTAIKACVLGVHVRTTAVTRFWKNKIVLRQWERTGKSDISKSATK